MRRLGSITISAVIILSSSRHRYRLQTGFTLPLIHFDKGKTLNYLLSDEIFVRTITGNTSTDQNRLLNGVQVKNARGDLNVAYQYTVQKEGNSYVNKNQLLIIININL